MARELLMMQNNYEWGTAEGQTLEIENAIRSNIRDLKIEGQTYQNLSNNIKYEGSGDWINVYNISENGTYTFKSDNKSAYITLYDNKAIKLLKENSVYTLVFDVDTDFVNYKGICINGNGDGYFDQSTNIYLKDINTTLTNGSYKFKFTMGSVTNVFAIGFRHTNTITGGTYFRAYNFKLLKGDYTNTELPTSINGIESVAEREFEQNLYTEGDLNVKGKVVWYNVKKYVAVKPNATYTFSCNIESVNKGDYNAKPFIEIYTNEKLPSNKNINLSESGSASFTTNNEAKQLIIYFFVNNEKYSSTECEANFKNIELYESNVYPVKITNGGKNLLAEIPLPQPLRSLPNSVCDEVVGNKLIQRVGKMIVDGTHNISISEVRENTIRFYLKDSTIKNVIPGDLPFLCDSLPKTGAIWSYDVEGLYQNNKGNMFFISISKSKLAGTTINDVNSYFAANPMTLYYELATPIEHTINVPRVPIAEGSNMITTANNIKPNLSIKYKKSKK